MTVATLTVARWQFQGKTLALRASKKCISESSTRANCELEGAVKRVVTVLILTMTFGVAGQCFAASNGGLLRGVIRDVHGAPQMGALVELLSADASVMATAFTDDHGRYLIQAILPGHYQVRASAAFLLPATRSNLHVQAGAQMIVNLTMSTLFEAESWLPAQKRRADEPVDDWKWALRSTASRPLLRLVDSQDPTLQISSSAAEPHKASQQARVSVTSGDGDFGQGGVHQVMLLNRTLEDGDSAILRVDMGDPPAGFPLRPSTEVSAGYERRSLMGGNTRLVTSYQSHPELTYGTGAGLQVMRLASTQQVSLGDAVMIDAGTLMQAERLAATRFIAEPFVRVMVRPSGELMVEYRYASGRTLQSSEDLNHIKPPADVLTDATGRPLSSKGSHQEISVSRKLGTRTVAFAVYSDNFSSGAIAGSGLIDRGSLDGVPVIADPTTGTFRMASNGYWGRGLSGSVVQPLTSSLAVWGEYDLGTALWSGTGSAPAITTVGSTIGAHTAQAGSVAIRGKILHTGTSMKAEYRWQPLRTLTQVNSYNATPDEGYLGFYIRQRLWCGRILPEGIDAVVEATNLLEQGYQPVLAPDGHTLFLAQLPRAVQGGLAFNF